MRPFHGVYLAESDDWFTSCSYHVGKTGRHSRNCCCSWWNRSQDRAPLDQQLLSVMAACCLHFGVYLSHCIFVPMLIMHKLPLMCSTALMRQQARYSSCTQLQQLCALVASIPSYRLLLTACCIKLGIPAVIWSVYGCFEVCKAPALY